MLYRAQDSSGTSRIGYAESTDGLHFTRRPQPVLSPETDYEKNGGVEDPRLQKFGDTYYLTYTAYNKIDAQLCLATSRDLIHWHRRGVIVPANRGNWNVKWTKSGAIVPEKIAGKFWMYWLGTAADGTDQMGLSSSPDLLHWTEETQSPVLPRRPGQFDSRVVEPGPPPILTPAGILLIYNAADDHLTYRTAIALFDRRDPRKLISRSSAPTLRTPTSLGTLRPSPQRRLHRRPAPRFRHSRRKRRARSRDSRERRARRSNTSQRQRRIPPLLRRRRQTHRCSPRHANRVGRQLIYWSKPAGSPAPHAFAHQDLVQTKARFCDA